MQNEKGHTTISPIPSEELYRFGADGNLRMYCYDRIFYSLYGYDAGTTRTYKYSFDLSPNWVNGRLESVNFNMHNAMFYPNSYLNFNQDGYYTKHYYNGMERIASRLGDQNLSINVNDPELQDRKWQLDSNIRRNVVDIAEYEFLPVGEEQNPDDPKPIYELPVIGLNNLQPSADGIFYYHPNHLGSTCYVTDENASVVQGFLYAPFGEITNEYNSSFGSSVLPKYSFNAKELDEETGMYYYEARYYAPPTFTSRDPLFEKYFWISPYAYCANNPVKYVDPDGREKIMAFNINAKNEDDRKCDRTLTSWARQYTRNRGVIHLFAHGWVPEGQNQCKGITIYGKNDDPHRITTTQALNEFLKENSAIYRKNNKNGEDSKTSILVLHSCKTGQENAIAQKASSELDLLVIAPSEDITVSSQKTRNGKMTHSARISDNGVWNIYYRGELVDSFCGTTKPLFDNPYKTIKKYEAKYNEMHNKISEE